MFAIIWIYSQDKNSETYYQNITKQTERYSMCWIHMEASVLCPGFDLSQWGFFDTL